MRFSTDLRLCDEIKRQREKELPIADDPLARQADVSAGVEAKMHESASKVPSAAPAAAYGEKKEGALDIGQHHTTTRPEWRCAF